MHCPGAFTPALHFILSLAPLITMTTAAAVKTTVHVFNAGAKAANGIYLPQAPSDIPIGFAKVCKKSFWDTEVMWEQLSDLQTPWYLKEDDAYIYFNRGDGKWWIDHPSGHGLYIADGQGGESAVPPTDGWESLREDYGELPTVKISNLKGDL